MNTQVDHNLDLEFDARAEYERDTSTRSRVRPMIHSRERNVLKQAALSLPPLLSTTATTETTATGTVVAFEGRMPTCPNPPEVYNRLPTSITVHFSQPYNEEDPEPELVGFEVHLAHTKQDSMLGNGVRRAIDVTGGNILFFLFIFFIIQSF